MDAAEYGFEPYSTQIRSDIEAPAYRHCGNPLATNCTIESSEDPQHQTTEHAGNTYREESQRNPSAFRVALSRAYNAPTRPRTQRPHPYARPPQGHPMRLSKSRFTAGLQCHRLLWWKAHEPGAPELVPGASQEAIFNQGSEVGVIAQQRVPGGVLIDFPFTALTERVEATKDAIAGGADVIYEASFFADSTFAAVDILKREGDGWRLIEVKSTTRVKREHLGDIAVQLHVLRSAGLTVTHVELMHLNRACVFPDLSDLFTRVDVTARVEPLLAGVPAEIVRQLAMLRGPIPEVPIGRHCDAPYECPFKGRCWPVLPEHHISTLYFVGNAKWDLEAQGITTIDQLPADFLLKPEAARQVRAVLTGETIVLPGLAARLARLRAPVAILDFETVAPAVPVWNGCHPYDPMPVQFSCHIQDGHGGWTHHAHLAAGPGDPRPELVRRLALACAGAGSILAYHSDFEKRCLELMAAALPELREPVRGILERLEDALPIVRVIHGRGRNCGDLHAAGRH